MKKSFWALYVLRIIILFAIICLAAGLAYAAGASPGVGTIVALIAGSISWYRLKPRRAPERRPRRD